MNRLKLLGACQGSPAAAAAAGAAAPAGRRRHRVACRGSSNGHHQQPAAAATTNLADDDGGGIHPHTRDAWHSAAAAAGTSSSAAAAAPDEQRWHSSVPSYLQAASPEEATWDAWIDAWSAASSVDEEGAGAGGLGLQPPPSSAGSSSPSSPPSSSPRPPAAAAAPAPPPRRALWEAIRAEARRETAREPLLSSNLHASVLAHDTLERALAFILSNRLCSATLPALSLYSTFFEVFSEPGVRLAVQADLVACMRDPACVSPLAALLHGKGLHSLCTHRVAHALWTRGQRVMALALQARHSEVLGVDIHPAARLGSSILLDHAVGVVIGETCVIGDGVTIMQDVTLGGTGKESGDRHPKIGFGVLIGPSAKVLGNIAVGEGAQIAPGSLVLKPVEPHALVAGSPARVVRRRPAPAVPPATLAAAASAAATASSSLSSLQTYDQPLEQLWQGGGGSSSGSSGDDLLGSEGVVLPSSASRLPPAVMAPPQEDVGAQI